MIVALQKFRTFGIAMEFYKECEGIKLSHFLRDQLTRASESIVLNLGEGSAKPSAKDRARFYSISLGSFRECQVILSMTGNEPMLTKFDHLGGCLYRLSRSAGA